MPTLHSAWVELRQQFKTLPMLLKIEAFCNLGRRRG